MIEAHQCWRPVFWVSVMCDLTVLTLAATGSGEQHILMGVTQSPIALVSPKLIFFQKKLKRHSIALYIRELSKQGITFYLEVIDDATGRVKVECSTVRAWWVKSLGIKISILNANKANESSWIRSLTCVSIPVLCDHNVGQGHLGSPAGVEN